MAETAFMVQYRDEFIAGFEEGDALLRSTVTTESVISGNQAVFLVADSGGATATTRGVNGLIPARVDNLTQLTCTLQEWHDLSKKTDFNLFAGQGNQRKLMQDTTRKVLNRKVDADIIAQLDTATNDTGSAATGSLALVAKVRAILGNAEVPVWEEDSMFFVATPAFEAYLMQVPAFTSADYVDVKPVTGPMRRLRRWMGFNWIFHPNLTGVGTSLELCYAFHKNAIGHAIDTAGMDIDAGYDREQKYSWARASANMGSKLLQQSGIVQVKHDGSAYVAS